MTNVLMIVFYFFALIGMCLFGGMIRKNLAYPIIDGPYSVPSDFHLVNFNDLFSSYVTLFTLMVVNNWMIQVSQYTFVTDGIYSKTWVRLYFIAFYYFSVIIGINLVIAFILDMYTSTERLEEERLKTLKLMEEKMTGVKQQEFIDHANDVDRIKDQINKLNQIINEHK